MLKRFSLVFFILIIAVAGMLVAAKEPIGPNSISYADPANLFVSIGMAVFLFIPPLGMAFFENTIVKIISTIYQSFIALTFLVLIPVGFFVPNSLLIVILSTAGTVISIGSIVVTLNAGSKKEVSD